MELFHGNNSAVGFDILNNSSRIIPTYSYSLISRYLAGQNILVAALLSILVLIPLGYLIYQIKAKKHFNWLVFSTSLWILIGLIGLSFYKDTIYDHYLGFMNPAPYLLLGALIFLIPKKYGLILSLTLAALITLTNLPKNPLLSSPNRQLFRTQEISKYIIAKSENKQFNFALIAQRNYDSAYQFYLYKFGHTPAMLPSEVADQLFVVCEDPICNPTTNPKFEISGFGMSRVVEEENILGVQVFKLVHNPTGNPS